MVYPDGAILEMRIWRLPECDAERPHGLKYSLFYGQGGARIIGYDNDAARATIATIVTVKCPTFFRRRNRW